MSERLAELKRKFSEFWETIKESEAYLQIKEKYDELDTRTKITIQLGAVGGVAFMILLSVLTGIAKVSTLKGSIDETEALIGYLQHSSDSIRQLKMQAQSAASSVDAGGSLGDFASSLLGPSNIDPARAEIASERDGSEEKDTKEILVDVKLSQVNLRQVSRFMINAIEEGKKRSVAIKELNVDTKGDPSGYMDAQVTLAAYRPK